MPGNAPSFDSRPAAVSVPMHAVHLVGWATVIGLSLVLDRRLAVWLADSGIARAVKFSGPLTEAVKVPGYFYVTALVAAALCLWHPLRWRAAIFEMLGGLVGGSNAPIKWMVGRTRPFKLPIDGDTGHPFVLSPFKGGLQGLVHPANNLSFVSGHTAMAFATAAGLAILLPAGRPGRAWVFVAYAGALAVAFERVAENAHWLSDVVCAAALGVWGMALLSQFCKVLFRDASRVPQP